MRKLLEATAKNTWRVSVDYSRTFHRFTKSIPAYIAKVGQTLNHVGDPWDFVLTLFEHCFLILLTILGFLLVVVGRPGNDLGELRR